MSETTTVCKCGHVEEAHEVDGCNHCYCGNFWAVRGGPPSPDAATDTDAEWRAHVIAALDAYAEATTVRGVGALDVLRRAQSDLLDEVVEYADGLRALLAAGTPQPTEEPKAQTVAELRAGLARYGMRLAVLPADTAPATTRTDPTNQRCPICAGTGWVREAKPGEYVEID
jgi:hypothetical protein